MNKTKIIMTINQSISKEELKNIIVNGVDVIKIDMNSISIDSCRELIEKINEVDKELTIYASIMLELNGPTIRIGRLINGEAYLKQNDKIRIYMNSIVGDMTKFSIDYNVINDVKNGNIITLTNNKVQLKIIDKQYDYLLCEVIKEGYIYENSVLKFPNTNLRMKFLNDEDKEIIKFAHEENVDFLSLSTVNNHDDILDVNDVLISLSNEHIQVVSKIETSQAVEDIDNILKLSDAVMIDRKNLGFSIPAEKIPGIQKKIIKKCHEQGIIGIVSNDDINDIPTRSEVSDIANSVLDGVDAICLSSDSIKVDNLKNIERIIKVAENDINYDLITIKNTMAEITDTTTSVAYSVANSAEKLNCKAIFAPTISGYTAKKISRFRPLCPIIAISPEINTVKSLSLNFGVYPILINDLKSLEAIIDKTKIIAQKFLFLKQGDKIIITGGYPFKKVKHTNFMKIEEI